MVTGILSEKNLIRKEDKTNLSRTAFSGQDEAAVARLDPVAHYGRRHGALGARSRPLVATMGLG